jgi:hypothetical protein
MGEARRIRRVADPNQFEQPDLFEDLKHRTGEIYGKIRWWAIGPTRFIFWGLLTLLVMLGLIRISGFFRPPKGRDMEKPNIKTNGPTFKVGFGHVYAVEAHEKRQRVRFCTLGRTYNVKTKYGFIIFGDESTFRPTRRTQFSISQNKNGKFNFILERGGGWFHLSPLDECYVQFPNGRAWLHTGGTAAEFHVRTTDRTRICDRAGDVEMLTTRKLKKPVTKQVTRDGHAMNVLFRYSLKVLKLKPGESIVIGLFKNVPQKPVADNVWQHWNQMWNTPADFHSMPHPKRTRKPGQRRSGARRSRAPAASP